MASPERFGYKWANYPRILPEHEVQFRKWILPLTPDDFRGRRVLDAGCGIGANSFWALRWGAAEVVAFDFDQRTIAAATENLRSFRNSRVLFRSIFDIDWENEFDLTMAIGVIHHLEDPGLAVQKLTRSVKPGGRVLIWVYGYEGNEWIVWFVSPLRRLILSRLPIALLHGLTFLVSIPFFSLLRVLPVRHPYYRQLKQFRFWHVHSIIFDQLLPVVAHYYRRDEAMALLKNAGLDDITAVHVNNLSWTVIGTKPQPIRGGTSAGAGG